MRTDDFRAWLQDVYRTEQGGSLRQAVIQSRVSNCRTVERHEGDLDQYALHDSLAGLLARLEYSTDDQRKGEPLRHAIPINGNWYDGTATYRGAINLYRQFCEAWPPGRPQPPKSVAPMLVPQIEPKSPSGAWPVWPQPSEDEELALARIVMPYVRFLNPDIVAAIVTDNQRHRSRWTSALGEHGINPSAYLWDRTACAFPGIRRYAGSREIAQHHGHVTGAAARIEHALQLDDNDFPKHIWSFSFLGKKFPKHGPVRYSLAHLADHKTHGNRFAEDFSVIDGLEQSGLFGLYTCPTNTAYIATSIIKPTDFSGSMRNLLLRRAEALYGDFCNLLPEWLKIPGSTSESWELDQFDWATPVGGDQGVAAFLDFRNAMIDRLLADKSPDSG